MPVSPHIHRRWEKLVCALLGFGPRRRPGRTGRRRAKAAARAEAEARAAEAEVEAEADVLAQALAQAPAPAPVLALLPLPVPLVPEWIHLQLPMPEWVPEEEEEM